MICSFNSRPHKEVDLYMLCIWLCKISFNSRPHKEVDQIYCIFQYLMFLSIHDLTRRSTFRPPHAIIFMSSFNSRPHKEVDPLLVPIIHRPDATFNSRPHKEVDGNMLEPEVQSSNLSIHDLTRRSTLIIMHLPDPSPSFNSRPHKEVDRKYLQ